MFLLNGSLLLLASKTCQNYAAWHRNAMLTKTEMVEVQNISKHHVGKEATRSCWGSLPGGCSPWEKPWSYYQRVPQAELPFGRWEDTKDPTARSRWYSFPSFHMPSSCGVKTGRSTKQSTNSNSIKDCHGTAMVQLPNPACCRVQRPHSGKGLIG